MTTKGHDPVNSPEHYNKLDVEAIDLIEMSMTKDEFLSRWEEINKLVHDIVDSMGGSFSAEHGIGILKLNDMHRYKNNVALSTMRVIKKALDPENLFNPGKVLPHS